MRTRFEEQAKILISYDGVYCPFHINFECVRCMVYTSNIGCMCTQSLRIKTAKIYIQYEKNKIKKNIG